MQKYYSEEEEAEVSMSPLIDCVFLLLIFFLVSTMTKTENKDVDIDLPVSISAEKRLPTDKQIVIGIDKIGEIYYNGSPSTIMEVHQHLREVTIANQEMQIRLDADSNAPIHSVVSVVDMCQFNNLKNVVLRTYDEHYNR